MQERVEVDSVRRTLDDDLADRELTAVAVEAGIEGAAELERDVLVQRLRTTRRSPG